MATRTASLVHWAVPVLLGGGLALAACNQGTAAGTLVGRYAVHAVLVENTCGSGLPAQAALDFQVELREQDGVGYWAPAKGSRNSGSLSDAGAFRFTASRTAVITQSMPAQLQPGDFVSLDPDRDLKQQRGCAVTTDETISGNLQRWRKTDGSVTASALAADASSTDDLSAEHLINLAPSSGSDCDPALAAYGGKYNALPCKARYQLRGVLDTTGTATTRAGASAARAGSGGSAAAAGSGGT